MVPPPNLWVPGADAVVVADQPLGLAFYLAYLDGDWPNFDATVAAHPGAVVLPLTTQGNVKAKLADCEKGDLSPDGAANGVIDGMWEGIYTTLSVARLLSLGILAGRTWPLFAADWTGVPHIPASPGPGCVVVGCQWAAPSFGSPGPYDLDVALPNYIGLPPAPPAPIKRKEDEMPSIAWSPDGTKVATTAVGSNSHGFLFVHQADGKLLACVDQTADAEQLGVAGVELQP